MYLCYEIFKPNIGFIKKPLEKTVTPASPLNKNLHFDSKKTSIKSFLNLVFA